MDDVYAKINGERHYSRHSIIPDVEVLESYMSKLHYREEALKLISKSPKQDCQPSVIVTDRLRSDCATLMIIGNSDCQDTERWVNKKAENSHRPSGEEKCNA